MNTMQQEFDAVVAHLYKQGQPAQDVDGQCLYRMGSLSCAVGCRIPDSMYVDEMEFNNLDNLLNCQSDIGYDLPVELSAYEPMFTALQRVHDDWTTDGETFDTGYLDMMLPEVAASYGLTFTAPEA